MAKKRIRQLPDEPKEKMYKVVFTKDFEGNLNNKHFKHRKGEEIEVSKIHLDWLLKHGAIKEC